MTDKEQFVQMLIGARVPFTEKLIKRRKQSEVTVDGGNGAVAIFIFNEIGLLAEVEIDKDNY